MPPACRVKQEIISNSLQVIQDKPWSGPSRWDQCKSWVWLRFGQLSPDQWLRGLIYIYHSSPLAHVSSLIYLIRERKRRRLRDGGFREVEKGWHIVPSSVEGGAAGLQVTRARVRKLAHLRAKGYSKLVYCHCLNGICLLLSALPLLTVCDLEYIFSLSFPKCKHVGN